MKFCCRMFLQDASSCFCFFLYAVAGFSVDILGSCIPRISLYTRPTLICMPYSVLRQQHIL